jgi:hypothetical protein
MRIENCSKFVVEKLHDELLLSPGIKAVGGEKPRQVFFETGNRIHKGTRIFRNIDAGSENPAAAAIRILNREKLSI